MVQAGLAVVQCWYINPLQFLLVEEGTVSVGGPCESGILSTLHPGQGEADGNSATHIYPFAQLWPLEEDVVDDHCEASERLSRQGV